MEVPRAGLALHTPCPEQTGGESQKEEKFPSPSASDIGLTSYRGKPTSSWPCTDSSGARRPASVGPTTAPFASRRQRPRRCFSPASESTGSKGARRQSGPETRPFALPKSPPDGRAYGRTRPPPSGRTDDSASTGRDRPRLGSGDSSARTESPQHLQETPNRLLCRELSSTQRSSRGTAGRAWRASTRRP